MTVYNLSPPRWPKIHYKQSLMLRGRSFSGCGRALVSVYFVHQGGQYIENKQWCTNVNTLRLRVAYLNATINSKTRNAEQEFGTDRSSQHLQNPQVDGYESGLGQPRGSGLGFWTGLEPNGPVFRVQIRTARMLPEPLAGFPDPLLPLCGIVDRLFHFTCKGS